MNPIRSIIPERLARTASPAAANHDCVRCSRIRDQVQRDVPGWRVPEAESWIGPAGARVWGAMCANCAQREREERVARAVANGEQRDVAARRFGVSAEAVAERARKRQEAASAQQAMRAPGELLESDGDPAAARDGATAAWLDTESPGPVGLTAEEFEARRRAQLEELERRGGW